MNLSINIKNKSIGQKHLLSDFFLSINDGEKVAFIGRNGTGKTTLFKVLSGEEEYEGEIVMTKNATIAFTLQEHFSVQDQIAMDYILSAIPKYNELTAIINSNPETFSNHPYKLQEYCDALTEYTNLGYNNLKSQIIDQLKAYQISEEDCQRKLATFSGGEKRYLEMVKVMYSQADLLCLDEPTNHMDYEGKQAFINWLKATRKSILIISHDRDVLEVVDRIVELKDRKAHSFKGNYANYLKRNSESTVTNINKYEDSLRQLEILEKKIEAARAKKAHSSQAKIMEEKLLKEYDQLKDSLVKPSFWIDGESDSQLDRKSYEKYMKFKDRTIKISGQATLANHPRVLMKVNNLVLGYEKPLFQPLDFTLHGGTRVQIKGRNGYGKSTFLRSVISINEEKKPLATIFSGVITFDKKLRIGVYEQELGTEFTQMVVSQAIQKIYLNQGISLTKERLFQIMSQYLFDPTKDSELKISSLSGGQKARLQIIKMFANNPELLILDEPTNHLDLPSIEELETTLNSFSGAILYVSHDSYFNEKISDKVVEIIPV